MPKTLVFAKDDSHAEDIVRIVREEFGKGDAFCQKITYKVTGTKPEDLINDFRNSYNPRIAVTVDMIATGTDVKPMEVLLFMRQVRSANFFEQMLGRGTRVISETDLRAVTPDARRKTHFVIVDAVGVVDHPKVDVRHAGPQALALAGQAAGSAQPSAPRTRTTLDSLAVRLARLDGQLDGRASATRSRAPAAANRRATWPTACSTRSTRTRSTTRRAEQAGGRRADAPSSSTRRRRS